MYRCESKTIRKAKHQRTDAFPTVMWEKTRVPLNSKEIKPVNPKWNQPSTDAETETPILWPSDVKSSFTGKDPHAGKDWGQEEKALTEDEITEWHHQLKGHEFEQAPRDSEGQGSLACIYKVKHDIVTEQQGHLSETMYTIVFKLPNVFQLKFLFFKFFGLGDLWKN